MHPSGATHFRRRRPARSDAIDPSPSVAVKFAVPGTAEVANSLTHGLGFVLSLMAATVLLKAARLGDAWQLIACAVYSGTMISVYATSTASHVFKQPKLNHFLRMLDQGCIYLFIAGTFTPIAATYLRNGNWWILLTAMWAIAAAGFVSKVVLVHRIDSASVAIPVLLGWMPLVGGPPMLETSAGRSYFGGCWPAARVTRWARCF